MFSQLYLITTSRKKWKITQEVYTFCIFHDKFVETENNSVIAYRNYMVLISPLIFFQVKIILYNKWDVTKTGNGERGTGNRERESGNEFTAATHLRTQRGGQRKRKGNNLGKCEGSVMVVNISFYQLCSRVQYGTGINKA